MSPARVNRARVCGRESRASGDPGLQQPRAVCGEQVKGGGRERGVCHTQAVGAEGTGRENSTFLEEGAGAVRLREVAGETLAAVHVRCEAGWVSVLLAKPSAHRTQSSSMCRPPPGSGVRPP